MMFFFSSFHLLYLFILLLIYFNSVWIEAYLFHDLTYEEITNSSFLLSSSFANVETAEQLYHIPHSIEVESLVLIIFLHLIAISDRNLVFSAHHLLSEFLNGNH
jgi:hypothetical protein